MNLGWDNIGYSGGNYLEEMLGKGGWDVRNNVTRLINFLYLFLLLIDLNNDQ